MKKTLSSKFKSLSKECSVHVSGDNIYENKAEKFTQQH